MTDGALLKVVYYADSTRNIAISGACGVAITECKGSIYAFGSHDYNTRRRVLRLDTPQGNWTRLEDLPTDLGRLASAFCSNDDTLVVMGGHRYSFFNFLEFIVETITLEGISTYDSMTT